MELKDRERVRSMTGMLRALSSVSLAATVVWTLIGVLLVFRMNGLNGTLETFVAFLWPFTLALFGGFFWALGRLVADHVERSIYPRQSAGSES